MFRCPNCARVHKLRLNPERSILPDTNMTAFWLVKEPFYQGNMAKAFTNMLVKMDLNPEAPGYDENGNLIIPMEAECKCSFCDHVDSFEEFHNAWVTPIDYFDAEQLCHCGTELWMDRIPYTNKYGLVCDRCGWVKPDSIVSGNADTTSK